jgi:hypothetical protein
METRAGVPKLRTFLARIPWAIDFAVTSSTQYIRHARLGDGLPPYSPLASERCRVREVYHTTASDRASGGAEEKSAGARA